MRPRRLKLGTNVDSGQMYRVYRNQAAPAYSSFYFFIFLSLQFSNIKIFCHNFLRPRRLKLGTRLDSGQMYRVYWNQAAAAYSSLKFSFSFSPIFKHENFSSHFSQELWGLKVETCYMWKMGGCIMYASIMLLLSFIPLFFFIFLSLQFSKIKSFVTLFSGTVRPRKLKHGSQVDSGQLNRVYRNKVAAAYLFLYFFIFLSVQFCTI